MRGATRRTFDVTEASSIPDQTRLERLLVTPAGRVRWIAVLALILGTGIVVYIVSRGAYERRTGTYVEFVAQLQNENRKLADDNTKQLAKMIDLQSQIDKVKAELNTIMPSESTYSIRPNQSILAAAGNLAVGLIGSPTNQSVNINVNGEQRSVAAGDVIHTALNPSTRCKVGVQSFDMFKAVVTATCAAEKPQ
jgi:hypothetical protein